MEKLPKLYITDKILAKTVLPLIPHTIKPNHVTMLRFIATPVVWWFLWQQNYPTAFVVFVLVAFTDALDGAMARTRNQITTWGKIYDPLADKLLICSVIYIIVLNYLNFYLACAIIGLEFAIILAAVLKNSNGVHGQANWWGKTKMICQVVAVSFLLLAIIFHIPLLVTISAFSFMLALIFGFISLLTYSF